MHKYQAANLVQNIQINIRLGNDIIIIATKTSLSCNTQIIHVKLHKAQLS